MEAKAGDDYEATSGVLLFEVGEKEKTISIKIVDDEEFEPTERFSITLYNPKLAEHTNDLSSVKVSTELLRQFIMDLSNWYYNGSGDEHLLNDLLN